MNSVVKSIMGSINGALISKNYVFADIAAGDQFESAFSIFFVVLMVVLVCAAIGIILKIRRNH